MDIQSKSFEPTMSFADYKEYYKERFEIKREDGIIEVKMHTNGGDSIWDMHRQDDWVNILKAIGSDPENEVLIITTAGNKFESGMDMTLMLELAKQMQETPKMFQQMLYDCVLVQSRFYAALLRDVDIPVISAINGPGGEGGHMEFMLMGDIRLCTPDVRFGEPHFALSSVPGSGAYLILSHFIGSRRANYMTYTGQLMDAKTALEYGVVNEVLEREQLNERAWELARDLMKQPRAVRRLSHEVTRKPWREMMRSDLFWNNMAEGYGGTLAKSSII